MGVSQSRQRPRRRTYERSGMLSRERISAPQCMHDDRGFTIERLRGSRAATTFMKLPTARLGTKATAASPGSTGAVSAVETRGLRSGRARVVAQGDHVG